MSTFSTASSSSCSSYGPSTPYYPSSSSSPYFSSDDTFTPTITTPPGSLRDYSASLKASHTLGMAKAMQSIPLDRPRRFGSDSGMDDNPFDALFSPTPQAKTLPRSSTFGVLVEDDIAKQPTKEREKEKAKVRRGSAGLPPFKPALLNFRQESDESTPQSVASESSFEAGAPEDYFRVYGRKTPGEVYSPFDLSPYLQDEPRQSPLSFYAPETPLEQPNHRMSIMSTSTTISTASSSTVTSLSSTSTVTAQVGVAGAARLSRPTLLRPRPRVHPYETSGGGRQRETSGGSARGLSFTKEEEAMKDDGRSVSEVMVAMAGLRCQRGRGVRAGG